MDDFTAVMIAEGVQNVEEEDEYITAWQHLIDTGICWRLQGWFGRTARELIESGYCLSPQRLRHSLSSVSSTDDQEVKNS